MSRLEKESPFGSLASTSQEGPEEEKPSLSTDRRLKVTLLSSEWKSSKGGLSTINRELAIQLAKQRNVEVSVYLPQCSEDDKKVAGGHNVQLIEAEELPGFEPIDWLSSLPKNHLPHCVIGHGVHLGRQIPLIKRHHHDCKWIQVVHTAPEELGMYKSYEEAVFKGEQKHQAEVKLCELADQVVAVGPKLADVYSRYLRFSQKDQDVLNLTPSIFTEFHRVKQASEERNKFSVLAFGRGDNEDFMLKGYDIAVQAIAELKDTSYQLMFVGAPAGKEDEVAKQLLQHGIPPSQLTVRRFNESREQLAKLFCEVDLAIMPSRTEGFGLTALEALSAGLPVLVSGNSGLGDALKKVPSGSYCVVDSEDPKEWAKAIRIARQKVREIRLEEVKFLREKYALKYSWQKQCTHLVEKMLHLTFGFVSTWQPSAMECSPSPSRSVCPGPEEGVTIQQEGSIGTGHQPTVEAINPLLSHAPSQRLEGPTDPRLYQKGSLEGREGSTGKGKRWLSLAGTQSSDYRKGSVSTWQPSAVECSPSLSHSVCPGPEEGVTIQQEGSIHTEHQPTVEAINPLPSRVSPQSLEESTDPGLHQKGSLECREGSTGKGKRWLSLAGTRSSDHHKGDHRALRKLLEDEYIRRSNLKPLIWDNTIHLPLDEVYARLEVKWRRKGTFQLTDKEIHIYEIFNLDKRDGKSGWFQRLHHMFGKGTQEKARMVLVEGSPGIGKTTFCLKIANDWARKAIPKKHDFPVFQLMLLLKCRDMDGDVMQAINDQLLPEDMTEEKKEHIMDYIKDDKNQAEILIILDGLDELPKLAEQFVGKLLRRKVLSHCSILATSRQEKGIEVRKRYDFDSLLQINGFTIEDASDYIRKHFKNVDSEDMLKGEKLIQAIKGNTSLHALRSNPLNLLLLCVVFEDFSGDLPSSRSELYQIIFRCLLRRFCTKNCLEVHYDDSALENLFEASTRLLGEIAWRCLLEDRPSFVKEELEKLENMRTNGKGFQVVKLGFVYMEASVKKLNPPHEYYFAHRTFQEYLAAVYLALKMRKKEISVFDFFQLSKGDITSKYRQVFLFVAGILGKDGAVLFTQMGEILYRNWNWLAPNSDCTFLIELLNESGVANDLAMVVCPCIPLPQNLEVSLQDWHTLKFVRYAHEASSLERNLAPVQLTKLSLTTEERQTLTEDSASDVHRILDKNKVLKDLVVSVNNMTSLLAITLLKGLPSCSSLSSFTLKTFESIPPDVAVTFGRSLSSCHSLTTVTLKLFSKSNNGWACAVDNALSASSQLKSVTLEFYGLPSGTAVEGLKMLLSNTSLISLSLILAGNMEDCFASSLSEGLAGVTALESLTVIVHGSMSNLAADLFAKGVQKNKTLHSLTFKVFGDVPDHLMAVVDKIRVSAADNSWKSLVLHPNVQGKFEDVSSSLLTPISNDNILQKIRTINIWGELSTCETEAIEGYLLKMLPLSSLVLNVYGKVSDGVADCLVKFFVANNVLFTLTINLWGEITRYGQTALQTLRREGLMQTFILNVHGLVTEGSECLPFGLKSTTLSVNFRITTQDKLRKIFSESKSLNELSLAVHSCDDKRGDWGQDLGNGLAKNKSLTTFSLTVHNYAGTRGEWGYGLGIGLAQNKSLTTFSLTVHNYADTGGVWGYGLGNGLAENKSLATFSLTVHNYAGAEGEWGYRLRDGLAQNKSLTTFSLTVHNYAGTRGEWGYDLGSGLAHNKSLTTFSLTVYNYADTGGEWGYGLGNGLAENKSLITFSLTVHDYADTGGEWGYGLGNGLAENKSLTTLSLTFHNYAETSVEWGHVLAEGLAKCSSLGTLKLSFSNYSSRKRDGEYDFLKRLDKIKTLSSCISYRY